MVIADVLAHVPMKYALLSLVALSAAALSVDLSAQNCVTDDFESFQVPSPGSVNIGTSYLEDTTVALGQGPSLVNDGCTYTAVGGHFWYWSDAGYFGLPSKSISSDGPGMNLSYDQPASQVSFDLTTNFGFALTVNITAYDAAQNQLAYIPGFTVPNGANAQVSIPASGVSSVVITRIGGGGSANIDNHFYCTNAAVPTLSLVGVCGQPLSGLAVTGMTPSSAVAYIYASSQGSVSGNAGSCNVVTSGLGAPVTIYATYFTDPLGEHNLVLTNGIPAAACGQVHVQAFDIGSCSFTNVLSL